MAFLVVELVVSVPVEDDSVEQLGVVDVIIVKVLEEGGLELMVRVDVLAKQAGSIFIKIVVNGIKHGAFVVRPGNAFGIVVVNALNKANGNMM